MNKLSHNFLMQLVSTPSPSGYEKMIQKIWREYVIQFTEHVDNDLHGNYSAVINPEGKPKIMLAAHCDELGFIIKFIDELGFIYFEPIGGHDHSIIAGRHVIIIHATGNVIGITCKKSNQLIKKDERNNIPEISNLWIDIGATTKKEALKYVSIGDPVVYADEYIQLNNNIVVSRGFDDKIGVFVIAEVLRLLKNEKISPAVFCVSTVQEEIGLRGAHTISYSIDPMIGIAIDVTHATDHPEMQPQMSGEIKIGEGPVILRGPNANVKVVDLLILTAKKENIPFQIEASANGTNTDANIIQLSRKGVATGLVSIPLRYMHTPTELISIKDVENTIKLLVEFAKQVSLEMDFRP